jgi:thiol:disulfide interchange protein DsbA
VKRTLFRLSPANPIASLSNRPLASCAAAIALLFAVSTGNVVAAETTFVEGEHYQRVVPQQPTKTGEKIEVLEIFWYGCPHCYSFEPYVHEWLKTKADDVEFRRLPGVFRAEWVPHARAYYSAQALGVLDTIHVPLFEALHLDGKPVFNQEQLADFFETHGVAKKKFNKTFDSFSIDGKTRQAMLMSREYGISGVPAVIINGKYRSSATAAGNFAELLKLIDHLVDKERQGSAK